MEIEKSERRVRRIYLRNNRNFVQEWLPIESIFDNGVIKLKDGRYIKILKIIPINYNLKSEFEKEAVLNSYKIFLKTCNFDLQILIQSNKEDLSKHISSVNNSTKKESKNIRKIAEEYIKYLEELSINKKSAVKNFYIIIQKEKKLDSNKLENVENVDNIIFDELNDAYLKIKDTLSRCGNITIDINNKDVCKNILFSFFYPKKILNQGGDNE